MKIRNKKRLIKHNNRYSAKLLFQWRVVVNGVQDKRRLCEVRIVLIRASNGKEALRKAKRIGSSSHFQYKNNENNPVYFEFVGVLDLLRLGLEMEKNEVWYDIVEKLLPMERKKKIIPPESDLCAIRNND